MVVGGTCLTTEVGICSLVVTHESHQTGTGAAHAALQQLLYEEGGAIRNHLFGFRRCLVNDLAVAVFYLCNQNGVDMLTVVYGCTVGIDHFQQVDVAGS